MAASLEPGTITVVLGSQWVSHPQRLANDRVTKERESW